MYFNVMKLISRRYQIVIAFLWIVLLSACDQGDPAALAQAIVVDINDIQSVSISPQDQVIETGDSLQFVATGLNSAGNDIDLTQYVSWQSSNTNSARVDDQGLLTSIQDGTVTVSISLAGYSASTTLTASSAALVGITIESNNATPSDLSVSVCRNLQMVAMGTYDDSTVRDITDKTSWLSAAASAQFKTAAEPGLLSTSVAETVSVSASLDSVNQSADVTVIDDIQSMSISPETATIAINSTQTYSATADFTGAVEIDISSNVSWESSNISVADFQSANQVVTGLSQGTAVISASCGGLDALNTSQLSVTSDAIVSMSLVNNDEHYKEMLIAETYQVNVEGTRADGTTEDVTEEANWRIENLDLDYSTPITVSNIAGEKGLVTANSVGLAQVIAEIGDVSEYIIIQVKP